jgi:hypothetical protein
MSEGDGSRSDGFSTNVFPQAMAIGNIHMGTIAGKLKGVMPAQTPSGWRTVQASMPAATCSVYSPLRSSGMPVAYSTTSRPRCASPLASESTFPCSEVMAAASRSRSRSTSSLKRNMTRARRSGEVSAQGRKAFTAAETAAPTSASLASATRPVTWPVAGSNTSLARPLSPARC